LPETLFVFLAFSLVLFGDEARERYRLWFVAGLSLGIACLFKSFALVAPVGLALAWYALMLRGWDVRRFLRSDLLKISLTGSVALMCFLVWPILDPEPSEILRHFVLEENVGKLGGDGYFLGLIAGPYTLPRLWLGHFGNAGLLAVPLAYLVVVNIRDRASASTLDKGLWIFVLSFLIVYSIPAQRQENYLLPTVPALSMLLASRWRSMGAGWFRLGAVLGIIVAAALTYLMVAVRQGVLPEGSYAAWQLLLPFLVLAGWLTVAVRASLAPIGFHALVFATYLALSGAMAPFEGPAGRFEPERVAALSSRTVFVPENFIRKREKHRFLLPGARIEGYDPLDTATVARLLERGRIVVIHRGLAETNAGPYRVLARRLDLTSRHSIGDMWRIAMQGEVELLVRQELVVRRFRQQRERRP
jgi:4-amino-4-deoxy-L-arabinose transferase-like glycosyltransferase